MTQSLSVVQQRQYAHLIDGDGEFTCSEQELTQLVKSTLNENNLYSIVAIMGVQSSGKSTLLNLLFGTQFREMDATKGRSQTTKGVWLDSGIYQKSLVVMDLEGTDSAERGEDRTTFERQTALYALALAEILILNMWEHDIGRYTASNYGILKTVFEVNLKLLAKSHEHVHKTIIMFLIRDHIESDTPLAELKMKLLTEVQNIWKEVRKPEVFADTPIDTFFEFQFSGLPHMKLQRDAFNAGVDELRAKFIDPASSEYLFNTSFHGKKSVPADGFGHYAHTIWTTIKEEKDLDLPSQKEMLATFRCDEIIGMEMRQFEHEIETIRKTAEIEVINQFAEQTTVIVTAHLQSYDTQTVQYHPQIVATKRGEFIKKMSEPLFDIFSKQVNLLTKDVMNTFTRSLKKSLANHDDVPDEFYSWVNDAKSVASKQFQQFVSTNNLTEFQWKLDSFTNTLNSQLDNIIQQERTNQLNKLDGCIEKLIHQELSSELSSILRSANKTMWSDIRSAFDKTFDTLKNYVESKANAYEASDSEKVLLLSKVKSLLVTFIRLLVEQHAQMISLHMRNKFDKLFKYDSDGISRRWKSQEEIRSTFHSARNEALALLELFGAFQLNVESTEDSDIIIPVTSRIEKDNQFRLDIEGALREAESERERQEQANKIPMWAVGLIAFLGFDELMAILRNPLLLFLIVVIGIGGYVAHQLGMIGPLLTVAKATVHQLVGQLLGPQNSPFATMIGGGEPTTSPSSSTSPATQTTHSRTSSAAPTEHSQQVASEHSSSSSSSDEVDSSQIPSSAQKRKSKKVM